MSVVMICVCVFVLCIEFQGPYGPLRHSSHFYRKENEAHWEPHLSISFMLYIRTYFASKCNHLCSYKLNNSPQTRIFLVKCFLCPPIPSSILGFRAIRKNTRKEAMRLQFCFVNPARGGWEQIASVFKQKGLKTLNFNCLAKLSLSLNSAGQLS